MSGTTNVMIAGVGGQGTLLASRIIGALALRRGFDVKVSEVHGMAQRGGSVVTYVRYSDGLVASPVICRGEADFLLCFEQLEAARWLPCLKKGGDLIVSTQKILPMPVITGAAEYPEGILEKIRALGVNLTGLDALRLAVEAGNAKAANVVMIGAFARLSEFAEDEAKEAVKSCVPPKFLDVNLKAFELGFAAVPQSTGRSGLKF